MPRLRFLRPSTELELEKRGIHPPIWPFIGRFYYLRLFAWLLPALISASLEMFVEAFVLNWQLIAGVIVRFQKKPEFIIRQAVLWMLLLVLKQFCLSIGNGQIMDREIRHNTYLLSAYSALAGACTEIIQEENGEFKGGSGRAGFGVEGR